MERSNGTAEKVKVSVNLDALTIGDLELMDGWQRGDVPIKQVLDILDRVVEGDIRSMPISALREIVSAIGEAVAEASDSKN